MSIRKVSFAPGEYYHIFNRGNSKQKTFHDTEDYQRFIGLLYVCNQTKSFKVDNLSKDQELFDVEIEKPLVSIGAYVLMPNHFHILLTTKLDDGISKFMQKLTTAYVMYYNKKYKRTGSLFEGKFKSEHSDSDVYLKYLFSYIHLNPIKLIDATWKEKGVKNKRKAINFLNEYQYTSFIDYQGAQRIQGKVLNSRSFPNYFPKPKDFITEISSWITLR